MIRLSIWAAAFSFVLVTVFAGCRTMAPPVTYYTLSPIAELSADTGAEDNPATIVGIRSVDLPGYVNRIQMVTRSGPNQLEISSLHRWADYPDRLVQQMLGENLQVLMPETRVVNAPWSMGLRPDVTVAFAFLDLIGTEDNQVLLSAVWTLSAADPKVAARPHRLNLSEPITGEGFDELAAAHSRVLADLARKVADSLNAFRE